MIYNDANTYVTIGILLLLYHLNDNSPLEFILHGLALPLAKRVARPICERFLVLHGHEETVEFIITAQIVLEGAFWTVFCLVRLGAFTGYLKKYELQPGGDEGGDKARRSRQSDEEVNSLTSEAFRDVLLSHMFVRPLAFGVLHRYVVGPRTGYLSLEAPLPDYHHVFFQLLGCMLIDDTYFYIGHRLLHTKHLYKRIHKRHHAFRRPNVFATEYAHPLEDILVNGLGSLVGPLLLGVHPLLLVFYAAMKLYQSMEAHSGYFLPFPLSLTSLIDSMDSSCAHDFHHSNNVGNFGGWFMFWDWILGTDAAYAKFVTTLKRDDPAYANARRPYVGRVLDEIRSDDGVKDRDE